MKTIISTLLIFSALFVMGCGSSKNVKNETAVSGDLAGTEWVMFEMDGNKYEAAEKVTIKFDDYEKKISGKAPCNTYGAACTKGSNKVSFADIFSTKMACDNMNDEQTFFDTMKKVYAYQTAKDMLYFFDSGGMVIFRFKAK